MLMIKSQLCKFFMTISTPAFIKKSNAENLLLGVKRRN